jgi:glycine cleavage system regulatory protein
MDLGKANDIAATAAAVTIEQALVGIHQEAGLVIGVKRTQSHPSTTTKSPRWPPMMCLQILQKRDVLLQFIEGLAIHGPFASSRSIRQ